VPQFYLRKFSEDQRSIRLLHKQTGRIISRAQIKGQCAVDNLHGWNEGAEGSLSKLESAGAAVISWILKEFGLPDRNSTQYGDLLLFVAVQALRTVCHAAWNDKLTDHFFKTIARNDLENIGVDAGNFVIKNNYPVALPISAAITGHHHLESLEACLLASTKGREFVTSDNPVVLYNSAMSHVWWEGVTGLDSEGLQLFFPLSPQVCLYMYDPQVYGVASNTPTRVIGSEDSQKMDCLQILNSGETLYAMRLDTLERIVRLRKITEAYEDYDRVAIVETEAVPEGNEKSAQFIANYRLHPPAAFSFRFARVRQKPKASGIRSDRAASHRRASMIRDMNARSARVQTATVTEARSLLTERHLRQLSASSMRRQSAKGERHRPFGSA
jgi:hypothetical protein